ncbi:hypothetical protein ACIQPQ_37225 [Streptomyces sp. NPDC091281]|uniref:hypothetical protein n=1 Tax=Streptomyces sp. NPDC091281 TaxID=3365985 RepID=UPI003822095D
MASNKYGAVCAADHCSVYVQPGAGVRTRLNDRWQVYCPADAPQLDSADASKPELDAPRPAGQVVQDGTNRFAGLCVECSVPVAAGAGVLVPCEDGKRRVQCPTCQDVTFRCERWNEKDQFGTDPWITDVIPAGCASTLPVRVLALTRPCWKCGEATTCIVGLHPERPSPAEGSPRTVDESSRAWVKELLHEQGFTRLAASIKPRWSSTLSQLYLSNGCLYCDALQGDFPLEEEVSDLVRDGGVEALDTLFVTEIASPRWQRVVHGTRGRGSALLI